MRSLRFAATLLALTGAAFAQSSAQATFDKLKSLEGNWSGKTIDGRAVETSYRVTSGGSAVMGEIKGKEDMISMFSMDGGRLLMTHYCAVGNQPRMAATASPDGKTITFNYVDATNLLSSQQGRMQSLAVTLIDANHYTEAWEFAVSDGSNKREFFDLHRTN